ncbi:MAG: sugar phosphate isomerase/epimerase [Candidatus Binatia bacterium]|nr:sugar phosphate isomerase/epimerase [Candidatus Binatia bacterium]
MNPKPLAVNLYSVRRELIRDFEGTLFRIRDMGYVGVEPMVFGDFPLDLLPQDLRVPTPKPERFRELLDGLDLRTASLHGPLPATGEGDYALEFAQALGTDQLVLASFMALPDLANAHADADLLAQAIDRFNVAAEFAAEQGIALGFHNHHFEWLVDLDGRYAWDLFWEGVDPRVNVELDVYWAQTAGRDPVAEIEKLGSRVRRVHLKDGPCVLGEPQVAVGAGIVDIEGCVRAATSVDWHIVELDDCATDIFGALEASANHLIGTGLSQGRNA